MKKLGLFIFMITSLTLWGQEDYIELSGKIIDQTNKEAITYVNIFLCGKSLGTSSNHQGEFILKIPTKFKEEMLCISRLGYQMKQVSIIEISKDSAILILLQANTQELEEVVILDKEMPEPKNLMEKVFKKFKRNYPSKPYLLESYYRDYLSKENVKSHILESAIALYDPSFEYSSDELRLKIYQSKVSNGYIINYQEYYENNIGAKQGKFFLHGGNQLSVLNFNNPIRNFGKDTFLKTGYELNEYFLQNHEFYLEQLAYEADVMLYVLEIKAKTSHPYFYKLAYYDRERHKLNGKLWIRSDNFAIQKFVYDVKIDDKIVNQTEIEYQLSNKKMYPKYLSFSNFIEIIEDEIKSNYIHHRELFVNEIKTEDIPLPDTFQLFDTIDTFQNSNYMSNQSFWNQYNTIKLESQE